MNGLQNVEITQKHVHGYRFQYDETLRIDVALETRQQTLNVRIDGSGVDVVTDKPSNLLGYSISWEQIEALINNEATITTNEDEKYLEELEQEVLRLREEVREVRETGRIEYDQEEANQDLDYEYAKPL